MDEPSFGGLLLIVAVAFAAPFLLGLSPRLRLPSAVLELVAGIVIGPSVLGWVEVDQSIEVVSVLGLAFLLFIGGLEIDFARLRGRILALAAGGYAISFALSLGVAFGLGAAGLVATPFLVAIVLAATGLGVIIAVLRDAEEATSTFGALVIAGGSLADFSAIILLSLFFSGEGGPGSTLLLIATLGLLALAGYAILRGAERSRLIRADLLRLQDTTAQIRVRGAILLFVGFAALAERLGLEVVLGAFAAGALLSLVDRDEMMTHGQFRLKLEAIGFGFFIPVFFVTSGVRFDLASILASASAAVMIPVFVAALLVVRGLPALVYRPLIGTRRTVVAGLFQATSLPFIVASTAIGAELGLIGAAERSALVAAGLVSVLVFPLVGLMLLRGAANGAPGSGSRSDTRPPTPSAGFREPGCRPHP